MVKQKKCIIIIIIITLFTLTGCSSHTEISSDSNTATESTPQTEEKIEDNSKVKEADNTEVEIVTQEKIQSPSERMVEIDEAIINLGDYTYLTLYLNQSREAVLHDFGEPTQSMRTDDILIYDDFGFIMAGDSVMMASVSNGEMFGAKTGITRTELESILGAPHDVTDSGVGDIYWYIDKDRAISASIENDIVQMIGYGNYQAPVVQEDITPIDIGEYVYMTDKGLVLRSISVEDNTYITGIVENISNETRRLIDLEFAFYDADGNKISHDWDYLTALQPNETWKYQVRLDDKGTQFKLVSLESE